MIKAALEMSTAESLSAWERSGSASTGRHRSGLNSLLFLRISFSSSLIFFYHSRSFARDSLCGIVNTDGLLLASSTSTLLWMKLPLVSVSFPPFVSHDLRRVINSGEIYSH
jgi:hypothetical protein